MKKIEVFRKSDNELVAGDCGESVTTGSLSEKMIYKLDINSGEYTIVETEVEKEVDSAEVLKELKDTDPNLDNINDVDQLKDLIKHLLKVVLG